MMSTTTDFQFFQRGRINAKELVQQDPKFILDYANRYNIPKSLAVEEIVTKIFETRPEFIPVLPNHTWALEGDRIALTERREPPSLQRSEASRTNNSSIGDGFPEPPEDTYSRSPTPSSAASAGERPLRLPLVFPPMGHDNTPVPDDWLQQMFEEYQENHETVATNLQKLVEEVEKVSYETVRVMSKIRKEQADTWRLLDTIKEICGSEFLNKILRDVHATTKFEFNRKQAATGLPSDTVLPNADGDNGGQIRSKVSAKDKQIFSKSNGSTVLPREMPSTQECSPSQLSDTRIRVSSSNAPFVEASTGPQETSSTSEAHPSAPESGNTVSPTTVSRDHERERSEPLLRRSNRNKRARPVTMETSSESLILQAFRSKRRKASSSVAIDPVNQDRPSGDAPSLLPGESTSPVDTNVASTSTRVSFSSNQQVQQPSVHENPPSPPPPTARSTSPVNIHAAPSSTNVSSSSKKQVQQPFDLWGPTPSHLWKRAHKDSIPSNQSRSQASGSADAPSDSIGEMFRLWAARSDPVGMTRTNGLLVLPSQLFNEVENDDHSTNVNSAGNGIPTTTSTSQPTAGSSQSTDRNPTTTNSDQPTASSSGEPLGSPSQPAAGSSQSTAGTSSQPTESRRPAPLRRTYERLVQHSDGRLEIIDYDTPERRAEAEEMVRDMKRRSLPYTLTRIVDQCAPRYPFLFAAKDGDGYHTVSPPISKSVWLDRGRQ
ncbi:hypothetical protein F5880DRAFT_1531774 [Lentinula raphanica]|nr:hypothetical protein F5880DRAFT_1531774 [Lentinula raphanica]